MPKRSPEEVINDPIDPEEFKTEDSEEDIIDPADVDMDDDLDLGDEEDGLGLGDEDELDLGDEEVDPMGDAAMSDLSGGLGGGLTDDEFSDELGAGLDSDIPQMVAPEEQIRWTPIPQENGDIWSEHTNGFVLRARPLSAQQGENIKYAAQLFKDDKIIDKGVIWIDKNAEAQEILQNIADRILDRMGLSNLSQMEPKPETDFGEIDDLGPEGEAEEDLGMEDAEIEDDLEF